MHRIDAPGNLAGAFTEGDPQLGQPPTTVSAAWLQDVQENIAVAIEGCGIPLSKGNGGQLLEAIRLLSGAGGRRNKLINGSFVLNARGGTHVFTTGTPRYTLDRWLFSPGTANSVSVSILQGGGSTPSFSTGLRSSWLLKWQQTAALNGSTQPMLSQRIENVLTLSGGTATLTVWALAESGAGVAQTITPKLVQFKGTGQGVAATLTGALVTPVDTALTRYTWTFDVPAIAATALAADNYLELQLVGDKTATKDLSFYAVQLEPGNSPTVFEDLQLQDVELLAARFYEKSYALATAPGTATTLGMVADRASGAASYGLTTRFRVEKRATPTVVWYAPLTGTAANITYGGSGGSDLAATPVDPSPASSGWPSHSSQAANESWGHWTADAEL